MHYAFSTPNRQDVLAEFPPVNRENLLQLAGELLHTFLVLPLDPNQRATLREVHGYISNVISKDRASPAILSSAKATAFLKTRQEVFLPRYIFSQSLKRVVVRRFRSYRPPYDILRFTYGSDFILMPSSSTCKSSQTQVSPISPLTTHTGDSWIFGREIDMESRYASRQFGHGIQPAWRKLKRYAPRLFYWRRTQCASHQTFHRKTNGRKSISHPNLLPVLKVSKTQFPFCIMSPGMLNGNITQYTQKNPDADRLTLVCAHQLEDR
jgi:hypothetical protein